MVILSKDGVEKDVPVFYESVIYNKDVLNGVDEFDSTVGI